MTAKQAHGSPERVHYIGVRRRQRGRYSAEISSSALEHRVWLGTFDTDVEAALAYDKAARALRGQKAKTNFPLPTEIERSAPQSKALSFKRPWTHAFVRKPINVVDGCPPHPSVHAIETESSETYPKRDKLTLDLNRSPPQEEVEDARPDADNTEKTCRLLGSI